MWVWVCGWVAWGLMVRLPAEICTVASIDPRPALPSLLHEGGTSINVTQQMSCI